MESLKVIAHQRLAAIHDLECQATRGRNPLSSASCSTGSPLRGVEQWNNEQIACLRHIDFSRAGLIIHVRSALLGREVLFVSDNVSGEKLGRLAREIYRPADLKKLALLHPGPGVRGRILEPLTALRGTVQEVRSGRREASSEAGAASVPLKERARSTVH
jgi:hypothetical protein